MALDELSEMDRSTLQSTTAFHRNLLLLTMCTLIIALALSAGVPYLNPAGSLVIDNNLFSVSGLFGSFVILLIKRPKRKLLLWTFVTGVCIGTVIAHSSHVNLTVGNLLICLARGLGAASMIVLAFNTIRATGVNAWNGCRFSILHF